MKKKYIAPEIDVFESDIENAILITSSGVPEEPGDPHGHDPHEPDPHDPFEPWWHKPGHAKENDDDSFWDNVN